MVPQHRQHRRRRPDRPGQPRQLIAALISHVSRRTCGQRTIRHLRQRGIRPVLLIDSTDPPQGTHRIGLAALRVALDAGEDLLLLEDDIRAHESFPAWLDAATATGAIVSFVCVTPDLLEPRHRERIALGSVAAGFYPIVTEQGKPAYLGWWGSYAVLIPKRHLSPFRDFYTHHPGSLPFDTLLAAYMQDVGATFRIASPNPVQHLDEASVIDNGPISKRSHSRRSVDHHLCTGPPQHVTEEA